MILFPVLEKIFASYSKFGVVRGYQVLSMLRALRPDLTVEEQEFENLLFRHDPEKSGKYDIDAFNQIALHYLVKQTRHDNDDFSHKHLITSGDFPEED